MTNQNQPLAKLLSQTLSASMIQTHETSTMHQLEKLSKLLKIPDYANPTRISNLSPSLFCTTDHTPCTITTYANTNLPVFLV